MDAIDPNVAVDFILKHAKLYAKAKSERVYLTEFRKALKARLFNESEAKTIADRENAAYAHPDYLVNLEGIKAAIEQEELLHWQLVAAQARVDIWRTCEASNRSTDKVTR